MFEKTLTDVVKGIRASKRDTALYISQCIAEIKTEINSKDMQVKANALQKLTFLQMMGYSMSWASFASIEVMSSSRFAHKRIAYLAASQGFHQDTEVVLLTPNLLKKELRGSMYEVGLAINCISNIVTEDLAVDLLPEITGLTSHTEPYIRKKAVLCLFKLFVKYPQGLRLTFNQIQKCLDDTSSSVVSCAVNVVTELSDKNPNNYLHLAPDFFQLLTTSSNNWMLIKVVKLLGSLVQVEPRLARKLLEPLAKIVKNTKAKSLLFESVFTITLCLPYCRKADGTMPSNVPEIVTLCATTLQGFVKESDQNLKYLGLVGFSSLMQSHPRVLSDPAYRPLILACLSDEDITIRTRALSLLSGMVTRKNLVELVEQLLKHVEFATGSYKLDLVSKIVEMCSSEKYALISNFSWYLDVLFQLSHMRGLDSHSDLLRAQITDVALRVMPVRTYAVRRCIVVLLEGEGTPSTDPYGDNGRGKNIMLDVLPSIAWIIGEYSDSIRESMALAPRDGVNMEVELNKKSKGPYHSILLVMLSSSNCQELSVSTQQVYLQASLKVFAAAVADKEVEVAELEACAHTIEQNIPVFLQSTAVEVQERAFTLHALLAVLKPSSSTTSLSSQAEGNLGNILGNFSAPSEKGISLQDRASISSTLNYILKPAPMKPASAKAQRKKRQSPVAVEGSLDASADLSIFSSLLDLEASYRSEYNLTMEAVSFTQQTPLRASETPTPLSLSDRIVSMSSMSSVSSGMDNLSRFQNADSDYQQVDSKFLRPKQSDPFYLNSDKTSPINESPNTRRLGVIELMDNDEEHGEAFSKKGKKKRKKDKHKKEMDTSLFEPVGSKVHVYESDEDDSDHDRPAVSNMNRNVSEKEFADLSKVDLLEPLREDEVMPKRKHRVVTGSTQDSARRESKKKESKKAKKKMKKASKKNGKGDNSGGMDLLDMTGFSQTTPTKTVPDSIPHSQPSVMKTSNVTSASDPFGDLLGLKATASPNQLSSDLTMMSPVGTVGQSSASDNGPWLVGALKNKSSTGSSVDWSKVFLTFKVCPSEQKSLGWHMVVFRVANSASSSLMGAVLQFSGHTISLGDIGAGSAVESDKVGPFAYERIESVQEFKGILEVSGSTVPVKITLPSSFFLHPLEGITLEDVPGELSSSSISSHSVKIGLSGNVPVRGVLPMLQAFLNASHLGGSSQDSGSAGTLAAKSDGGTKVFFLVKVKAAAAKIDIKCPNEQLGKSLCSDLKKVLL